MTDDDATNDAVAASAAGGGRQRRRLTKMQAIFAAVAAALGVATGLTALIDWVSGHLDHPAPPPPARIEARITDVTTQRGRQTLRDYLEVTGQPVRGYSAEALRERGYVFVVGLRVRGSMGHVLPLTWSLYEAGDDTRLQDPASEGEVGKVEPANQDDTNTWPAWIAPPPAPGRYYVRFVLRDPRGRLSFGETDVFTFRGS